MSSPTIEGGSLIYIRTQSFILEIELSVSLLLPFFYFAAIILIYSCSRLKYLLSIIRMLFHYMLAVNIVSFILPLVSDMMVMCQLSVVNRLPLDTVSIDLLLNFRALS